MLGSLARIEEGYEITYPDSAVEVCLGYEYYVPVKVPKSEGLAFKHLEQGNDNKNTKSN